jgi:hypothetical protein
VLGVGLYLWFMLFMGSRLFCSRGRNRGH